MSVYIVIYICDFYRKLQKHRQSVVEEHRMSNAPKLKQQGGTVASGTAPVKDPPIQNGGAVGETCGMFYIQLVDCTFTPLLIAFVK